MKRMSSKAQETVKVVGLLSLLAGFGLLATGCSKNSSSGGTSGTTYQVRIWRLNQSADVLKTQINKFTGKNKNVKVSYTEKTVANYELDAIKSMAAKQGPDIWSIPNDWLGDHAVRIATLPDKYFYSRDKSGKLASTGPSPVDQVKTLFPEGISEQLISTDGKSVYGMPTNVDTLRLYYNEDLMKTALSEFKKTLGDRPDEEEYKPVQQLLKNPPATWQDLVAQTAYITKLNGSEIERSTVALGTADNIPDSNAILQLLMMQNGSEIIGANRRDALFNVSKTTASGTRIVPGEMALDFYASFAQPGSETYSWSPSMPQALDAFGQGKVAMVIAFADFGQKLKIKYPKFNFATAAVPQNSVTDPPVNFIRFSVEAVTKTANSTNAAFSFLQTYTDSESAGSIASEAKLLTPYKADLTKKKDNVFANQILTGKTVYKKDRTQFDEAFRQMIIEVSQNDISSTDAINNAVNTVNGLLRDETAL